MKKSKKFFLICWSIILIWSILTFVFGRIYNTNFIDDIEFKWTKFILSFYLIYDFFKFNLAECKVDSQILYVLCIILSIIFVIAGTTYIVKLNFYRISEFSFFIFLCILFRICSISSNVPNFLTLKEK